MEEDEISVESLAAVENYGFLVLFPQTREELG